MISDFFYSLYTIIKSRLFITCVVIFALYGIIIFRLFGLQIINEDYYKKTYIQKAERTIYTPGTRGIITDRNGNVLAYNKLSYAVVI
ncbi:MAG: hypothetical protein IKN54_01200, partial [Lachnospiraceae bacterium]|nr:hypothetical protein [Lachnospiraceae bacterium]